MSDVFKIEYKGFTITYYEHLDVWATAGDIANVSLARVKMEIDKSTAKGFQRFEVIIDEWNSISTATVTSITEGGEYWVVKENGDRRKTSKSNLYKWNEDNLRKLKLIAGYELNVKELNKVIQETKKSLERI